MSKAKVRDTSTQKVARSGKASTAPKRPKRNLRRATRG